MEPIRIAMWSGPRNISTAMMRSWENRGDAAVSDEPLYAHYLKETRVDHPGRDEIIAACETDWRRVVAYLTGPVPGDKAVWYQKHMTHHLLPGIERGWVRGLANAFLIREPTEMITSLAKVTPNPRIEDTGLPQQAALFEQVREWEGKTPPVVDARDVLTDPRRMLGLLCEALGVAFTERMLAWPAGKRATDGVWAPHWYASVEKSTGFEGYRPKNEPVPERLKTVHDECEGLYRKLWRERLGR